MQYVDTKLMLMMVMFKLIEEKLTIEVWLGMMRGPFKSNILRAQI
jgi:hypothetical protein